MAIFSPPKNKNYCATVVEITKLVSIGNCDNLQYAMIFGNSVIVSKTIAIGDMGLFFPLETRLSQEFLKENNLFRVSALNKDQEVKGYFEENGRIRAVRFRGNKSEGYFISLTSLHYIGDVAALHLMRGDEFDTLNGFNICEKYVVKSDKVSGDGNKKKDKTVKESRLVDNQFRLMSDTDSLRKNVHKLNPDDTISISNKMHGTSVVVGNVLTKRQLSWKDTVAKFFGVPVQDTVYDIIYSSRRVIKNKDINVDPNHFYGEDIWGVVAEELKDCIPPGITLYGEIVGFLRTGAAIQSLSGKPYDYRCHDNQHDTYIYKITSTDTNGKVTEYSWPQMVDFCNKNGFKTPILFYYGKVKDLYPTLDTTKDGWNEVFLKLLEGQFIKEGLCPNCYSSVPEEGVVLSVETLYTRESYKCKNFLFLCKETEELDKGNIDIEETTEEIV